MYTSNMSELSVSDVSCSCLLSGLGFPSHAAMLSRYPDIFLCSVSSLRWQDSSCVAIWVILFCLGAGIPLGAYTRRRFFSASASSMIL